MYLNPMLYNTFKNELIKQADFLSFVKEVINAIEKSKGSAKVVQEAAKGNKYVQDAEALKAMQQASKEQAMAAQNAARTSATPKTENVVKKMKKDLQEGQKKMQQASDAVQDATKATQEAANAANAAAAKTIKSVKKTNKAVVEEEPRRGIPWGTIATGAGGLGVGYLLGKGTSHDNIPPYYA